jgi:hypothetical protein
MQMEIYSENQWRLSVIMNLVAIRHSIYALCLSICILAIGFFSAKSYPDAPMIVAVAVFFCTLGGYTASYSSRKALARIIDKTFEPD